MEVKTAELKTKLSQYLRSVREDGASYVVLDRKTPVARLIPLEENKASPSEAEKTMGICKELEAEGFSVKLPSISRRSRPEPKVAPDGRIDIRTIDLVRGGRDF